MYKCRGDSRYILFDVTVNRMVHIVRSNFHYWPTCQRDSKLISIDCRGIQFCKGNTCTKRRCFVCQKSNDFLTMKACGRKARQARAYRCMWSMAFTSWYMNFLHMDSAMNCFFPAKVTKYMYNYCAVYLIFFSNKLLEFQNGTVSFLK